MTTWLPPWAYLKLALTSHEMGHGYGFPHSSGTYGATYDNQWDVMSAPSTGGELATDESSPPTSPICATELSSQRA